MKKIVIRAAVVLLVAAAGVFAIVGHCRCKKRK